MLASILKQITTKHYCVCIIISNVDKQILHKGMDRKSASGEMELERRLPRDTEASLRNETENPVSTIGNQDA